MSDLFELIKIQLERSNGLDQITSQLFKLLNTFVSEGHEINREIEVLEKAEWEASRLLKEAEDALMNYKPVSAQEYGLQVCAILEAVDEDIIDQEGYNHKYVEFIRCGAKALANGNLK